MKETIPIPNEHPEQDREREKELPKMTVFLLRHGESEKDKTNPNRGLTEKGVKQVTESINQILNSLLLESNPEFEEWEDEEVRTAAIRGAIRNVEFHLRDSGTTRTLEQVWLEYEILTQYGVPEEHIYLPKGAYEYLEREPDKKAGPGIAKRLKGVKGMDQNPEYRMKIKDKAFQEALGASGDMMAWAVSPEEEVPSNVEKRSQMEARYDSDIATLDKVVAHKIKDYPKRVVAIANAHASIATVAAARESGVPLEEIMKKIGEVPEAQGLRYDFYQGDTERTAKPFGPEIEKAIEELKQ
ncbi:hypothetical protein KKB10_00310 [Patescibacteria group bacterium]|nr:hypothetical protein [Patescibacteria group bacterium]MBU1075573.1 hypothetical protein [Patescibacteria group bacterium]MBU1951742.1 hypothetical protein [Patescibacteria group bacterium]MBU2236083.1 hypothetical protein [Patescibacteria group bacterium]